jgi:putative transcriptional regulator
MSQESLAEAVGVTRQTILSIEKGKFVPSVLLALKIARYFNKPVEEIFYIVEGENPGK